ncbi:MAG: hypothetical protein IJG52_03215 [Lachnospiraceae bacterium]|nr:hypothetical protein [Lachnospiraceae bacterium]
MKLMKQVVVREAMNVVMVPGEGVSCDHVKLMKFVVREVVNVVIVTGEGQAVTTESPWASRGHRNHKSGHSAREVTNCDHSKPTKQAAVTEAIKVVTVPAK